jgi:hypothetical protein
MLYEFIIRIENNIVSKLGLIINLADESMGFSSIIEVADL